MNHFRQNPSRIWAYLVLLSLVLGGISIMMWLAPISGDELTPAQSNLITIADWMVKVSVGAILGLAGAGRVASNGG